MVTTESQPEIGKNESAKSSLISSLHDEDYFVAFNAADALVNIGMEEISGTPTREYARNTRDRKLQNDFNALFGR